MRRKQLRSSSDPGRRHRAASGFRSSRERGSSKEQGHGATTSVRRRRIEAFVRIALRELPSEGRRGCRKIGRVTFHRPIVAPQRRRTAVSKDGSRGPLPLSGRGRIRTAGSGRDASPIRSLADVIALAVGTPRPTNRVGEAAPRCCQVRIRDTTGESGAGGRRHGPGSRPERQPEGLSCPQIDRGSLM